MPPIRGYACFEPVGRLIPLVEVLVMAKILERTDLPEKIEVFDLRALSNGDSTTIKNILEAIRVTSDGTRAIIMGTVGNQEHINKTAVRGLRTDVDAAK
jgi:hypothetical protein